MVEGAGIGSMRGRVHLLHGTGTCIEAKELHQILAGFKVEALHNNPHWDWEIDVKQITLIGCS